MGCVTSHDAYAPFTPVDKKDSYDGNEDEKTNGRAGDAVPGRS